MKRLLAFAIAVMMVFAMVPVSVSAADVLPTPAAVDGVLTLGEGTYQIATSATSLDDITEIKGAGADKTALKLFNNGGEYTAIHIRKNDCNVKISGVTIDGSDVSAYRRGVVTEKCNATLTFENCEFKNLSSGVYLNGTADVTMINCTFTNCSAGIGTELTNGNLTLINCTFSDNGETVGWTGDGTLRIENASGLENFMDYGVSPAKLVEVTNGYGEWTRVDGELVFTDITPEPEPEPEPEEEEKEEPKANFFLFMFMKRLLTEYAVELVFDDTMGIVEVDDEDGYVRFSEDAVITVAALEGYEVESVLVNGEAVELDEDGTYTIKRIRKDAKVEVTFAEIVEEEIDDAE